jgi:NADPH:quinone reductase-like Zn-dependent oxidoreductase
VTSDPATHEASTVASFVRDWSAVRAACHYQAACKEPGVLDRQKDEVLLHQSRLEHFVSDLNALFDLLRTGRLSVPIKAVIPLRDIQRVHREWSQGAGIGSILIQVRE